jgi:hypothetical protein
MRGQHSVWSRARALVLTVMMVAALLLPATTASQKVATPPKGSRLLSGTVKLPPGAEPSAEEPQVEEPAYPKLESQLAQLYESAVLDRGRALETFAGQDHVDLAAGKARVMIEMDVDPQAKQAGRPTIEKVALPDGRTAQVEHAAPVAIRGDLAKAIEATGATYELAVGDLVQVLAPFGSLKALSEMAGVRRVRLPYPAQEQAVTSEGVALTGVNAWHTAGHTGTGINVAVFDFGFTGYDTRQANGDLPSGSNLVLKDYSSVYNFGMADPAGDYEHGTACAEIVYDMAPGSKIYLYAWGTDAEFANAVTDYETNAGITGNKVATMSIGYVNAGPYDGTGPIDAIVNTAATTYGIFWANAAGNQQKSHYSWTSAQYSTTDYVLFGTDQYEEFGPSSGTWWVVPAGYTVDVFLEWNDWNANRDGNGNHFDYDLVLQRRASSGGGTWSTVATGDNRQCTNSAFPPTEEVSYTPTANSRLRLYIQRYDTGCTNNFGHWMTLHSFVNTGASYLWVEHNPCNSLLSPADADGAVAAGATFWNEDGTSPLYGLEPFGSLGPRNADGGANPGTAVNKPDVVAPDGVSTATYGASNGTNYAGGGTGFFGTSAASPHVAGLAAVLWSSNPSWSLATLRTSVQSNALYKAAGTCGGSQASASSDTQNNSYGWGRISLPAPTSVELLRFDGWPERKGIRVEWEMSSDVNNLGFDLFRASAFDGPYTKLNEELIPSQTPGQPGSAVYAWTDADVRPARIYYYKLEVLDIRGGSTTYGALEVRAAPQGSKP